LAVAAGPAADSAAVAAAVSRIGESSGLFTVSIFLASCLRAFLAQPFLKAPLRTS
jgi:hypothetical protein